MRLTYAVEWKQYVFREIFLSYLRSLLLIRVRLWPEARGLSEPLFLPLQWWVYSLLPLPAHLVNEAVIHEFSVCLLIFIPASLDYKLLQGWSEVCISYQKDVTLKEALDNLMHYDNGYFQSSCAWPGHVSHFPHISGLAVEYGETRTPQCELRPRSAVDFKAGTDDRGTRSWRRPEENQFADHPLRTCIFC